MYEQVERDNWYPFSSKAFADFARADGFKHQRITPLQPRAIGVPANFMKLLNKTKYKALLDNKSVKIAIQELLTGCPSTPYPRTDITLYEAIMNRKVRPEVDFIKRQSMTNTLNCERLGKRDMEYKMNIKDNSKTKIRYHINLLLEITFC